MWKLSFRWKLMLTYGSIITALLMAVMIAFLSYNVNIIEKNMEKSAMEMLDVTEKRLREFLEDKDQKLQFFQTLPEFHRHIRKLYEEGDYDGYYMQNTEEAWQLQQMFLSVLVTEENSSAITYISRNYNNIHASVMGDFDKILQNQALRKNIDMGMYTDGTKYSYCIFPHEDYWSMKERTVMSVYRPVSDLFGNYGILVYDVDVRELDEILMPERSEIFLISPDKGHMYSKEKGIEEVETDFYPDSETGYIGTEGKYSYYYIYSDLTDWGMVMKCDVSPYLDSRERLFCAGFCILLISYAGIMALLYYVSQSLTNPLRDLKKNLENLEKQEENSYFHIDVATENDEVAMLGNTIENMMNEMKKQNIKLITAKELVYEAQLKIMEAQLNPHFLYNTLSVIGTYGLEMDNMTIPQMCSELSGILRYAISGDDKTVTFGEEIRNIKSYMYIMEMRYEDALKCQWELDNSIDNIHVPKLILQPVLENCFKHGFHNIPPVWEIRIRTEKTGGGWKVSVGNSGDELNREKIDEYLDAVKKMEYSEVDSEIYSELKKNRGIGLRSVILRLHMYYGGKEHFRIFTEDGMTFVELGGPIDGNEDESCNC